VRVQEFGVQGSRVREGDGSIAALDFLKPEPPLPEQ
jgi:hypothetical protein